MELAFDNLSTKDFNAAEGGRAGYGLAELETAHGRFRNGGYIEGIHREGGDPRLIWDDEEGTMEDTCRGQGSF